MTPAEADKRIMLSRKTVGIYMAMIERGDMPNAATMMLLTEEVGILEGIAHAHAGKAAKIARLIEKWQGVIAQMRGKLH